MSTDEKNWEAVKKLDKKTKTQYLLDMYKLPKVESIENIVAIFECIRHTAKGVTLKSKTPIKHLESAINITEAIMKKKRQQIESTDQNNTNVPQSAMHSSMKIQQDYLEDLAEDVVRNVEYPILESDYVEGMINDMSTTSQIVDEYSEIRNQTDFKIYEEALVSLIAMGDENSKWNEIEINEFKDIFKDPTHIKKRFTINALRYLTTISKSGIQGLTKLFGDGSKLEVKCSGQKSLKELTSDSIKSWPVDGINIAYGQLTFPAVLKNWNAQNLFKDE
ncbi:unnamed protein product [Mytilus coruscus]|uniref:Uncharacterized protein n=1 Tax=Mytilus coruscus TaxID=42192 RepID=A0A6J8D1G9_MYTCO|nr:unnamed protein product [Mytilus coruscus]